MTPTRPGSDRGSAPNPNPNPTSAAGRGVGLVVIGLLCTSLMSMLDQSIIATAAPWVVSDLGGLSSYAWVFTAYMLTFAVAMPVYGKLGDLFGRKPVYLFAISVFILGSVACAMAQTMGQLIAFRALQGLGGGGLIVSSFAILGELMEPRQRAKYQGYFAAVFALANLAGPMIGGVVTDQLGWRWAFYINLPIGVAALVLLALFLRTARPTGRPRIDYAGIALLSGTVVCLVLLSNWAGSRYGWGSPVILGLGAGAVVLGVGWFLVQRITAEPVMPLRLFQDSTFSISVVVAFVGSFAFFGCVTFLPLFFQLATGTTPTETGVLFLPAMIAVAISSLLAGQVIAKTGRYKWFPVASMALALVGTFLLSTIDADTSVLLPAAYLAVVGFGVGLSQQVTTLSAQNTAPPRDLGVATSTVSFLRYIGVSFGAAIFGSILNARLADELARNLPPDTGITAQSLTPETLSGLDPATQQILAQAYASAQSTVFTVVLPVVAIGLVAALLLKDLPLTVRRGGPGGGPGGPGAGGGNGPGGPGAGGGSGPGGRGVEARARAEATNT